MLCGSDPAVSPSRAPSSPRWEERGQHPPKPVHGINSWEPAAAAAEEPRLCVREAAWKRRFHSPGCAGQMRVCPVSFLSYATAQSPSSPDFAAFLRGFPLNPGTGLASPAPPAP